MQNNSDLNSVTSKKCVQFSEEKVEMTDEDTEEEKENKEEIESKYSDEGTPSKNNGNVVK